MRSFDRALFVLCALSLMACGPDGETEPPPPEEPKQPFECSLGVERMGVYEAGGPQCEAELTLGFQGFLWFDVVVQAGPGAPKQGRAKLSVSVPAKSPFNSASPLVTFGQYESDGLRLSSHMQVFVSGQDPKELAGQVAQISVRFESETKECITTSQVLLVDNDDCIHTNDEPCEGTDVVFEE